MQNLTRVLIALAVLSVILAIVASRFTGTIAGTGPEAFSRACSNFALIAIALSVGMRKE